MLEQDLQNVISTLDSIINFKTHLYKKQIRISNAIRYQTLFTYVYTTLQEVLITLNLIFVDEGFLNDMEDQLNTKVQEGNYDLHCSLFELAAKLNEITNLWFKSNYITQFVQELNDLLKCIFQSFQIGVLQNIGNLLVEEKIETMDSNEIIQIILQSICKKEFVINRTSS